jgi:hypothetical protein
MRRYCQRKLFEDKGPEEPEEEGKSIVCPTSAIDDFNEDGMTIIPILLNDGERNNQR